MAYDFLPTINAGLNMLSAILLGCGYYNIRRGKRNDHMRLMVLALIFSTLFLISYLIYHYQVGSVPYPLHDWTRTLYFSILIPHVILAAANFPFIIFIVRKAFKGDFKRHRRLARWVLPVWMFVAVTGVSIYLLLYVHADARG